MGYQRFLIWKYWGEHEGWHLEGQAATWDDAVHQWQAVPKYGSAEDILITEYVPLQIQDGRAGCMAEQESQLYQRSRHCPDLRNTSL